MDGLNFFQIEHLPLHLISHSNEETHAIGQRFGKILPPKSVVCFFGELGAGKTTFIKGLVSSAAAFPAEQVNSPTFTLLNIYNGSITIFHFDLYRLQNEEDFLSMGFDEYFSADGICCIEWSERIENLLPQGTFCVRLTHLEGDSRQIDFERRP